jgi:hypothetical protein
MARTMEWFLIAIGVLAWAHCWILPLFQPTNITAPITIRMPALIGNLDGSIEPLTPESLERIKQMQHDVLDAWCRDHMDDDHCINEKMMKEYKIAIDAVLKGDHSLKDKWCMKYPIECDIRNQMTLNENEDRLARGEPAYDQQVLKYAIAAKMKWLAQQQKDIDRLYEGLETDLQRINKDIDRINTEKTDMYEGVRDEANVHIHEWDSEVDDEPDYEIDVPLNIKPLSPDPKEIKTNTPLYIRTLESITEYGPQVVIAPDTGFITTRPPRRLADYQDRIDHGTISTLMMTPLTDYIRPRKCYDPDNYPENGGYDPKCNMVPV